ncbi:hypothetical protein BN8_05533 [Fibrisoma limi BUZ 3]|uniref:Metallo-beta-lactamase domain-containing protein n=1 Tax=Fibrisoma limi BUZ 3 TaxID=1185876 RepID=I2GQN5_9BACT|nr:MBL fold metallo-hydrolase [Fibrisoma limi]CCH56213.1 hypothetical protein BN8_05533 [Fibrisoma limi BUZ 3]
MLNDVTIRMYCTGFGDCFLLTFRHPDKTTRMLIDFGVRGGQAEHMQAIARHLHEDGLDKQPLDYLVITHEHEDHISGFRQARDTIDQLNIRELWLGWTERPDYDPAKDWRLYKEQTRATLQAAFQLLPAEQRTELGMNTSLLGELFRFERDVDASDEPIQTVHHTNPIYDRLIRQADKTRYFMPGEYSTDIPGVRIYVLGPPPIEYIRRGESHVHGELYIGADYIADTYSFGRAFEPAATFAEYVSKAPFDQEYIVPVRLEPGSEYQRLPSKLFNGDSYEKSLLERRFQQMKGGGRDNSVLHQYFDKENDWRRIDTDWRNSAEGLALKLNQYTNNTSLVLAIELIDTGEVLFFPGDAQYGVWSAWDDDSVRASNDDKYKRRFMWRITDQDGTSRTVTAEDLLANTVFYKVGHHGSHNATPKRTGLQKMTSPKLCALIPVDAQTARRYRWNDIPYQNLLDAFANVPTDSRRMAPVRFLRADDLTMPANWPEEDDLIKSKLKVALQVDVPVDDRTINYVDLTITPPRDASA